MPKRVHPATRRALGDCRSGRQGRTRAHGPHSHLGEELRRRVDSRRGHHARPGLPRDQQGRACLGETACSPRRSGMLSAPPPFAPASTTWPHTICGAPARVYAILPAAHWIRSSSCSVTSRFRRPSATSGVSRSSGTPSTTAWALNPMPRDSTKRRTAPGSARARLSVTSTMPRGLLASGADLIYKIE
jgi:hypothetical protein